MLPREKMWKEYQTYLLTWSIHFLTRIQFFKTVLTPSANFLNNRAHRHKDVLYKESSINSSNKRNSIESDKPYQKKAPMRCPNWVNILCIVFAIGLTVLAVGLFLGYYFGFRDPNEGFTKDTLYWVIGLVCAILGASCCLSCGVYCLVFRAKYLSFHLLKLCTQFLILLNADTGLRERTRRE